MIDRNTRAPGSSRVKFDAAMVERYGGRGPRYTSYPTALQFDERFTVDDYRHHAAASNRSNRHLSLYVHIPFCRSLCYYCGCNKIVTRNQARVDRYMQDLHTEISLQGRLFDRQRVVRQLHFGGGTPTYLSHEQLRDLMAQIGREFELDATSNREFSIEIDPRTVTVETLDLLAGLGFNRMSLGVQDFEPRVQAAVNRVQSADGIRDLTRHAKSIGFDSVSFDLIYGLPQQSVASFERTIDEIVDIAPDRLAVYNYAHLPTRFKAQRLIRETDLPDAPTKLQILEMTIERLNDGGYEYIGMDHFARPTDELVAARNNGTLQRNFQGYSTHAGCDLVALGVSAIGNVGNVYAQNEVKTGDYQRILESGRLPIARGVRLDEDDLIRAGVIQDIMCHGGVDYAEVDRRFGIEFTSYFSDELLRLEQLAQDRLVTLDSAGIRVTDIGQLLLRAVAMVFDRYLNQPQPLSNYSRAI